MFDLKAFSVCVALSAAGLTGGCGNQSAGGGTSMMGGLSKDDLMAKAQSMISQGQSMQDKSAGLNPGETSDGMTKDDLMTRGKALIEKGQALLAKAKGM